jgi:hypothetical protein
MDTDMRLSPKGSGRSLGRRGVILAFALLAGSGGGMAAGAGYRYPLGVSGDGRYLVDQDGKPFRIQGDAGWSAIANLTSAEQDAYLADRAAKGFNVVLASLFERKFASRAPNLRDGTAPFTTVGNLSTVNPTYLGFAASFVDKAAARGLVVMLDVMYLGYGGAGSGEGWYDVLASSSAGDCQALGTAIGGAFRGRPNVLFVIGGDYTLGGSGADPTVSARLQTLRSAVIAAGATQPWTAHWGPSSDSSSVAAFASLIDVRGAYAYEAAIGAQARGAWANAAVKPSYLMETGYENEHGKTPGDIRAYMWMGYLGSIGGAIFGASPTWSFGASSAYSFADSHAPPYDTWQDALGAPGSLDFQRMGALLDAQPWQRLRPAGLGVKSFVAAGGTAGAATPEGDCALVYVASTGSGAQTVSVDRTVMAAPFRARWWNPSNGTFADAGTAIPNTSSQTFTTPGQSGPADNDWLLVLDGAPGRPGGSGGAGSTSSRGCGAAPAGVGALAFAVLGALVWRLRASGRAG